MRRCGGPTLTLPSPYPNPKPNPKPNPTQVWRSNAGPCLAAWAVRKLKEAPQPFFMYYSSQVSWLRLGLGLGLGLGAGE